MKCKWERDTFRPCEDLYDAFPDFSLIGGIKGIIVPGHNGMKAILRKCPFCGGSFSKSNKNDYTY